MSRKITIVLILLLMVFSTLGAQIKTGSGNTYYIQSVQAKGTMQGFWDLPGVNPKYKKGAKLGLYEFTAESDRRFWFEDAGNGYYYIFAANSRRIGRLDLPNNKNSDGVQMIIWDKNKSEGQKFKIKHLGDGRFKIYTPHGRVLCTPRKYGNGQPVHTWGDHKGDWMEWFFIKNLNINVNYYNPDNIPKTPDFFINNRNRTFKYKESLAFVEGAEGTAVLKTYTDNKVILAVTATRRNQKNGKMETKTYDYEINYKDGVYFRGTKENYYEEGEIKEDSTGTPYLSLSGEQSSVKFSVE